MNGMRTLAYRLLLGLFMLSIAGPARAADDVAIAQAAITSHVDAIGRDDAATAYSYAAPAIKAMFPQPGSFLAMDRKGYAPIYRHKTFQFGESMANETSVARKVSIVDADGVSWNGLYTLDRQSDGSLKISGCILQKVPGQAI
ncbi:MAG: hypothetical protein JWQ94_41 [Tardiphaga sp.]|nr:hypothetical protein [Tardiphaga sp.]